MADENENQANQSQTHWLHQTSSPKPWWSTRRCCTASPPPCSRSPAPTPPPPSSSPSCGGPPCAPEIYRCPTENDRHLLSTVQLLVTNKPHEPPWCVFSAWPPPQKSFHTGRTRSPLLLEPPTFKKAYPFTHWLLLQWTRFILQGSENGPRRSSL